MFKVLPRVTFLLPILSVLTVPSAWAFQDMPLTCNSYGGVPTLVRAAGMAELVGQIVMVCSGGTPTPAGTPVPRYAVKVRLSTPAASRVLDTVTQASEASLVFDEQILFSGGSPQPCPATGVPCPVIGTGGVTNPYHAPGSYSLFQARAGAESNTIVFSNIPIDPPGPNDTRTIRIMNIRADVSAVPLGEMFPSAIFGIVTIEGTPSIPVGDGTSITANLAYLIDGVKFEARNGLNTEVLAAPVEVSSSGLNPSIASGIVSTPPQIHVRVSEQMGGAMLRTRTETAWPNADAGAPISAQVVIGSEGIATESGYFNPNLPAEGGLNRAGLADSGTRFYVLLDNVPPGVTAWASAYAAGKTNLNSPIRAMQPNPTSADGGQLLPAPFILTNAGPLVKLVPVGGRQLGVFEYTGLSSSEWPAGFMIDEPFDIAIYLSAAGSESTGLVTLSAGLAPIPLLPMAESPLPRFKQRTEPLGSLILAAPPACKPKLGVTVSEKSGSMNERNWAIQVTNIQKCDALGFKLTGASMMKIGHGAEPILLTPLPLNIGSLGVGQSTTFNLRFQVPSAVSKVKLKLDFQANGLGLPPENLNNQAP